MYAILRMKKLKSYSAITVANKHNLRKRKVPNSDKNKAIIQLVGDNDSTERVKTLIQETGKEPRKNAVFAIETVMSASPEFFKDEDKTDAWSKKNLEWAENLYGKNNIVSAILHLDEKTPHLHIITVPIHQKKLNARHFIGGTKNRLVELQTSYATSMKEFGLLRGRIGSTATHLDIKNFYSTVKGKSKSELSAENEALRKELAHYQSKEKDKIKRRSMRNEEGMGGR